MADLGEFYAHKTLSEINGLFVSVRQEPKSNSV